MKTLENCQNDFGFTYLEGISNKICGRDKEVSIRCYEK